MSKTKQYINLLAICIGAGSIFKLAMIKDIFYDPLQQALNITNTQMGLMITFFAITQAIAYLPGGWLVDLFPVKYIMPIGLITTGLLGLWEATYPSFTIILVIQMGYGLTITLLFWDAMLKATRILAEQDNAHGKMFGMMEGLRSLVSALVVFISIGIFGKFGEGAEGLQKTMLFFSIVLIVCGVITFFLLDKNEVEGKVNPKEALTGMIKVMKLPKVWLAAGIVFFGYSFYNGLSYMTPLLTNVFGMGTLTASIVANIRQYCIGIFAAPLGGIIADRMGSRVGFLKWCLLAGAVVTALFLIMPYSSDFLWLGILVIMATALVVYMMRGTYSIIRQPRSLAYLLSLPEVL